jgi:hypothetical protein
MKQESFNLPNNSEVDSILKVVIFDDSLQIAKNNKFTPIANNLLKLRLVDWNPKNGLPPRKKFNSLLIHNLIGYNDIPIKFFFPSSDSSFIKFQDRIVNNYRIKTEIFQNLRASEFLNEENKFTTSDASPIYYLTIPIFSSDLKKAYIESTLRCSGLCGKKYKIFLEKHNERWTIVRRELESVG